MFVFIILGIEIRELTGESKNVDASIEYLVLNHPELKGVNLGKLNCTDKALKAILSESDIVDIRVSNCGITGENLQLETGITLALKVLHLRDCWALTSQGLKNILEHLDKEKLKELNLSRTKVSLEELNSEVSTFPNLEIIRLNQCSNFTDIGLISFLNKSGAKLKKIDISSTRITLSEVGLLSTTLNSLEELNVSSCQGMTDKGLISFLNKAGGNLKRLCLSNTKITLTEVGLLITSLPRLEDLILSFCDGLTDLGLVSFLNKAGGNLKKMNLSYTKITLSEVALLTIPISRLEDLNMRSCKGISDMGLVSFLNRTGGNLKKMDLSDTKISLSEVGLLTITISRLEDINMSYCHRMTDKGLISFLNKAGGNLKKLVLSHTKITLSKVGLLTTSFPRLEEIDLEYSFDISQACLITLLSKTAKDLYLNIDGTSVSSYRIKARYPDIYVEFNE